VKIVPYDPRWPVSFQQERSRIAAALDGVAEFVARALEAAGAAGKPTSGGSK